MLYDNTPYGFTGEPTNSNGFVHLRARYYNPDLGNFISLDHLETANRYTYVDGNPANRIDPSGLNYIPPTPPNECSSRRSDPCSRYPEAEYFIYLTGTPRFFIQQPHQVGFSEYKQPFPISPERLEAAQVPYDHEVGSFFFPKNLDTAFPALYNPDIANNAGIQVLTDSTGSMKYRACNRATRGGSGVQRLQPNTLAQLDFEKVFTLNTITFSPPIRRTPLGPVSDWFYEFNEDFTNSSTVPLAGWSIHTIWESWADVPHEDVVRIINQVGVPRRDRNLIPCRDANIFHFFSIGIDILGVFGLPVRTLTECGNSALGMLWNDATASSEDLAYAAASVIWNCGKNFILGGTYGRFTSAADIAVAILDICID